MSDLHRKLADITMRRKEEEERESRREARDDNPWPPGAWARADQAFRDGSYKLRPKLRFPVLITPDGPVCSAHALQQLAEMESPPNIMVMGLIDKQGRELEKHVTIGDIDVDAWLTVEE